MKTINPTVAAMPRSGIRLILDRANEIGGEVLHLEIGQPDLATPDHIVAAAHAAAQAGFTGYTPNAGYTSLREAFAGWLQRQHQIQVDPQQVVVSAGAMGGLFDAFCALLAPGDEILLPDPGYPNYAMAANLLQAKAVYYPLAGPQGFHLQLDEIERRISPQTKAIVINSPANPTGMVLTAGQVRELVALAEKLGIYLISDEAYDQIVYQGQHTSPLKYNASGLVISVFSCSKTYSMTGWRVGFVVCAPHLAPLMAKLQEMYLSCAPSISQKAAEAALNGPQDCVREMRAVYRARRDAAVELCQQLGVKAIAPEGAFYLMVAVPEQVQLGSMAFALELVEEAQVAFAPGTAFGAQGEGYLRAALCASRENIEAGIRRFAAYCSAR